MALGSRHAAHGVGEHDYLSARRALLWTLERVLGSAFTPEVRESWATVYDLLAGHTQEPVPGARFGSRYLEPSVATCTGGDH
mgnify:CR=1 FL=1